MLFIVVVLMYSGIRQWCVLVHGNYFFCYSEVWSEESHLFKDIFSRYAYNIAPFRMTGLDYYSSVL